MDSERLGLLYIYLKGLAMGSADAVPGVSGGTIALITGIYERLIQAVTSITPENVLRLLKCLIERSIEDVVDILREMDGIFLAVLGAGIVTALVLVLRLMHYLLSNYTISTYGFFFGLIAASAVVLLQKIDLSEHRSKAAALTGFLVSFLVSGYASSGLGHSHLIVFISGMLAVSAMVLPGISGSLVLVILGQYEYMTAVLSRFTDSLAVLATGNPTRIVETIAPIVTFVSGGVVGLFTVAHSVKWALNNYRKVTAAFLVSLVAGALRAPVVEVEKVIVKEGMSWLSVLPEFGILALAGFLLVILLDYRAGIVEI